MAIRIPILWRNEDSGLRQAQASVSNFSTVAAGAFAYVGAMAVQGMAQAARAVVDYGVEAVKAAAESESIVRGLEQIAKNSSAFAATTSNIKVATKALTDHSTEMSKLTGIDDEVLNSMKRTWLAVPELASRGSDGLNKFAEVAADVAAGTGKDIESIGQAFIKVAGDEETALSKLRRAGIVLSDQQNATYDQILRANGQIAAQDYLIEQLGQTYAGAAEAAANPFARLQAISEDFQETVGMALLPALEQIIPQLQTFFDELVANPAFQEFLAAVSQGFTELVPVIFDTVENLLPLVQTAFPTMQEVLPTINSLIEGFAGFMKLSGDNASTAWAPLDAAMQTIKLIGDVASAASTALDDFSASLDPGWGPIVDGLIAVFNPFQQQLGTIVSLIGQITNNNKLKSAGLKMMTGVDLDKEAKKLAQRSLSQQGGIPGQAAGGITTRAGLSWVGENGPELLSLPVGAQVTPLDRISGGGSTYNINISTLKADATIGEVIVNSIKKYERTSGAVFASA